MYIGKIPATGAFQNCEALSASGTAEYTLQEGSVNADRIYLCTTDNSGSIGAVNITFSRVTPAYTGTVTSVAVADSGASEFTVGSSPITTSGTITLAVNAIDISKITSGASKGFATAMAIAL